MPWQELVDPLCRMIGETRQDIGKPCSWIDIVEFARLNQRIDSRGSLATGVRTRECPIPAPDRYAPQGALGGIVKGYAACVAPLSG
jgi:hypothetical protein